MAQTETPVFDQTLYAMAQEVHAVWLDMAGLPLTNDQLRPYTRRLCDLGNRLMTHAVHPPVPAQQVTVTASASSWAGGWNPDALDDSPPVDDDGD